MEEMVEIRPKIWRDLPRSSKISLDPARSHQIRRDLTRSGNQLLGTARQKPKTPRHGKAKTQNSSARQGKDPKLLGTARQKPKTPRHGKAKTQNKKKSEG